jgi:hypothetical protein
VVAVLPSGVMLAGAQRDFCRTRPTRTRSLCRMHFIQADSCRQIGETIAAWRDGLA